MKVPKVPLTDEAQEALDFWNGFRTIKGYFEIYEQHLRQYGKPGVAYEATEMLHVYFFTQRRYADRESFFNAKTKYYGNRKK